MTKPNTAAQNVTRVVRSTMRDEARHAFEQLRVCPRVAIELEHSGDAAHQLRISLLAPGSRIAQPRADTMRNRC